MEMCSGESEPKFITFTNDGDIELNIEITDLQGNNGNFHLYSPYEQITGLPYLWNITLQPDESVELTVTFDAIQSGNMNQVFTFDTNDPNHPLIIIRVYGNGIYVNPGYCE